MKRKLLIFLTGGLGNQLFQVAAGIHFANGRTVELDLRTARPRINSTGEAEVLSLNLPDGLKFIRKDKGGLIRRVYGFNLRSGYSPKKYEESNVFKISRRISSSAILSIYFHRFLDVTVSSDLGFDQRISYRTSNETLIGYFQSHLVARDLLSFRDLLFQNPYEERFSIYSKEAEEEYPLLVHIRLGDYETEDAFGVLSSGYYEDAITSEWESGRYKSIWLFSDQAHDAIYKIPERYREFTRIIPSEGMESSETLRIMTLCRGYIIANSTFSWWGAFLRVHQDAPVIAPKPWFVSLKEPSNLIPNEWTRLEGFI